MQSSLGRNGVKDSVLFFSSKELVLFQKWYPTYIENPFDFTPKMWKKTLFDSASKQALNSMQNCGRKTNRKSLLSKKNNR